MPARRRHIRTKRRAGAPAVPQAPLQDPQRPMSAPERAPRPALHPAPRQRPRPHRRPPRRRRRFLPPARKRLPPALQGTSRPTGSGAAPPVMHTAKRTACPTAAEGSGGPVPPPAAEQTPDTAPSHRKAVPLSAVRPTALPPLWYSPAPARHTRGKSADCGQQLCPPAPDGRPAPPSRQRRTPARPPRAADSLRTPPPPPPPDAPPRRHRPRRRATAPAR